MCYNANVYIVYHSYTFRLLNTKFSENVTMKLSELIKLEVLGMYVVPKIMFPFMWKKNNPPKTLHLKRKGEGVYGDLFTLTSFPSVSGIELILSYHDKENAYYEGAEGYPEFDILSDKRRAFKIKWLENMGGLFI